VVDDHSSDNSVAVAESFNTRIIRLDRQYGAAYARNRGAEAARGDILLFVDSDIVINHDCMEKVVKAFHDHPGIAALFGSYDDEPGCSDFCSQYKNLFHHYVHQTSMEDASTFWCGCGAIRREIFIKSGGFDQDRYSNASIEDIELGSRLKSMGYRILLYKDLQVKHLKRWTFFLLLRADIFYRAMPWSSLIIERNLMISDLNLQISDKISAGLVCLSAVMLPFSIAYPKIIYVVILNLSVVFILNYKLYGFFFKNRGLKFAVLVFNMQLLYYIYSSAAFAFCWLRHRVFGKHVLYNSGSGRS
jgi:GT2 family glycosyltransferase